LHPKADSIKILRADGTAADTDAIIYPLAKVSRVVNPAASHPGTPSGGGTPPAPDSGASS
jgi:hypothetical protein